RRPPLLRGCPASQLPPPLLRHGGAPGLPLTMPVGFWSSHCQPQSLPPPRDAAAGPPVPALDESCPSRCQLPPPLPRRGAAVHQPVPKLAVPSSSRRQLPRRLAPKGHGAPARLLQRVPRALFQLPPPKRLHWPGVIEAGRPASLRTGPAHVLLCARRHIATRRV